MFTTLSGENHYARMVFGVCLLYLLIFICCCGAKKPCPAAIPIEDIQNAFLASKIVYEDNLQIGKIIPYSGFQIKNVEQEYFTEGGAGIKVLLAEKGYTTIVAFRGTDGPDQLSQQLFSSLKNFRGSAVTFGGTRTSVNTFFWEAFKLLLPGIRSKLQDQARKYIITGHSLGGAMATILSIFMKDDGGNMWENPASCLITFGEPRVGNGAFAKKHDEMIAPSRKLRFVNNLDPVPHIPLWPAAHHHSREIWMTKGLWTRRNYWKVCKERDPLSCSNLWTVFPRVKDHEMKEYEDKIMSPPNKFYDKNSKTYYRWLNALRNSC